MVSYTSKHAGGLSQADNIRNQNNGEQGELIDAPTTSRMARLRESQQPQPSEEATELMLISKNKQIL